MLRTILVYGVISGAVVIGVMVAGIVAAGDAGGASSSQVFGYLVMLIALSTIFIAVKRHRDRERGGVIAFWPAFGLGLAIAGVAGVVYVIGWEAYLAVSDASFIETYAEGQIDKKREAGASEAEIEALRSSLDDLVAQYQNPLFRMPITFTEIFPVGALIALLSALILRNPKAFPARG